MSLSKQMIIFIASMLVIVLLGTFLLNLNNTRSFLEAQLQSHAQDTATSLGLSLSSVADPEDPSSMETMINAVFDRGYYSHITLIDVDEQLIYERANPQEIEGIPQWFIQLISIKAPDATALIQSGWIPVGTLTVQSHPGYAYIELWKTAINLLIWFGLATLIATGLAIYALKVMLKPLKKMEKQAEAIVRKEYLLQDTLPSTIEFKRVVSAMNAMVHKMKEVFERDAQNAEKLQKMAYQDSVTGMSNRLHFEMNVDALLDDQTEATAGAIFLLRIDGLKELNDRFGYLIGDKLVKMLADKMRAELHSKEALYARLNGTELIAVLPSLAGKNVKAPAEAVQASLPEILAELKADDAPVTLLAGLVDYQPGDQRGQLLSKLDFAISEGHDKQQGVCFYGHEENEVDQHGEAWNDILTSAINEHRFVLFQQSAYDANRQVHDQELLIRLKDTNGHIHSAGYFMPAVAELNLMESIDRLVIELALQHLQKRPQSDLGCLAINLTESVIENDTFQQWLLTILKGVRPNTLAFEMTETMISHNKAQTWPLIEKLKNLSFSFGIDHFGSHFTNMNYLQELRPNYIKLDAAFTKAIERDEQTQNYVSSLCEMCHSLDIQIIAMSVENEAQISAFNELGIQHFQGYYYGAPKPL